MGSCCSGGTEDARPGQEYKYNDADQIGVLTRFSGTALPNVLKRGLLWLTVAVYVACFIINKEDKSALPVINVASLAIPGAFVSFLVTFYHSTCYAKYFDSYKLCIQLGGKTVDFGIYVASIFENNLEEASSLTGLASLAQHRFFWMISSNK